MKGLKELIAGRQNNRILRLSFPHDDGPACEFVVNKLEAFEGLSRDFEFTIEVLSDNPSLALKDIQGKLLSVELVCGDGTLRYFSGYCFSFRLKKAENIAFYEAKLAPWFKYLSLRKDNYLFHNANLGDQTASIFADYAGHANWDLRLAGEDAAMTDACQFDESDANYLQRRWEAAGWHYFYEHGATGHKLVLSDDTTRAEPIDGGGAIRLHRHGGALEEDGIGEWSPVRQITAGNVALAAYDFKTAAPRAGGMPGMHQSGKVLDIESYEYTGAYGFKTRADGERLARLRMEELEAHAKHIDASGNNRHAIPGRSFRLVERFGAGGEAGRNEYLILEVEHLATNNYLQQADEAPHYSNRLRCSRKAVPWRPGRGFNSVETKILAPQTATVVGPQGQGSIHTDQYGRIRVQFHWDRVGVNDNASSAWLRVSSAWAGGQLGTAAIPRVGAEVIVMWLDGSPDRPIVTGAVHNARYMAPWALPSQQALTGLRSRELTLDGGNAAGGRSNHLILDDTNEQIQAQLKSDHQHSQLSLGHITRIENNAGRRDARGEGWELASDAWGVARAGKGMLITTEARKNAASHIKDMGETISRLAQAGELHEQMGALAQQHQAQDKDADQSDVAKAIKAQNDAIKGAAGGEGTFPELSEPHLVFASPSGIETTTSASTHIASGEHVAVTAGANLSVVTGKSFFASIQDKFSVFVHRLGIKLIAASGKVQIQAQTDDMELLAQKVLDIISTTGWINLKAKEGVRINGGGSEWVISAEGIKGYTPGGHEVHAADHQTFPKQSRPLQFPGQLPDHDICIACLLKAARAHSAFASPE